MTLAVAGGKASPVKSEAVISAVSMVPVGPESPVEIPSKVAVWNSPVITLAFAGGKLSSTGNVSTVKVLLSSVSVGLV